MIYTITAFAFLLLSLFVWNKKKEGNRLLLFAIIWLIILEGFRWNIGTDWEPYFDFFMGEDNSHMGVAYLWLNKIVRSFSSSYTSMTLLIAILTYATMYGLFRKFSPAPIMSILIYYCSMLGLLGSNRQFIAVIISVCSLYFVFHRKLFLFILSLAIAASFHFTALVFIPVYFIYGKVVPSKVIVLIILASFFISISHIVNRIPFVESVAMLDIITDGTRNFSSNIDSYVGTVSIIGSLKRLLFVFVAIMLRKKINNAYYDFFLYLYCIGTIIYLLFNGSVIQLMAGRGALYYSLYETLVIPYIVLNINLLRVQQKAVWISLFALYLFLMWRDINSYYLLDGVDIFNPYRSILL